MITQAARLILELFKQSHFKDKFWPSSGDLGALELMMQSSCVFAQLPNSTPLLPAHYSFSLPGWSAFCHLTLGTHAAFGLQKDLLHHPTAILPMWLFQMSALIMKVHVHPLTRLGFSSDL